MSKKISWSIIFLVLVIGLSSLWVIRNRGETTLLVYFSNFQLTEDCQTVFPLPREVITDEPKEILEELFQGPTAEEKEAGYSSWFSEETKDILLGIEFPEEGLAQVDLIDIRLIIPGANSSCGSAQFISSVEETLKQFEEIERVLISLEGDAEAFYEWMQIGCNEENNYCGRGVPSVADFSKIGNLTINNPGGEENIWVLVYDEPGAPGMSIPLEFTEESLCGESNCQEMLSEDFIGSRVQIEGEEVGEVVKVIQLTFQEESSEEEQTKE
jgi:hypothetical protein